MPKISTRKRVKHIKRHRHEKKSPGSSNDGQISLEPALNLGSTCANFADGTFQLQDIPHVPPNFEVNGHGDSAILQPVLNSCNNTDAKQNACRESCCDGALVPISSTLADQQQSNHESSMSVLPRCNDDNKSQSSLDPLSLCSSPVSSVILSDHCYASSTCESPEPGAADRAEAVSYETQQSLLLQIRDMMLLCLPNFWVPVVDKKGIHVLMLSREPPKVVQRSVFFSADGNVTVDVHCQRISSSPFIRNLPPHKRIQEETVNYFVDRAIKVVSSVRLMEICSGCDFEEYQSVWSKCEEGEVDKNPYNECRYSETFRSFNCSMLVDSCKWRCFDCSRLQRFLKRKKASETVEMAKRNTPNNKLTDSQKLSKLESQRKEILASRKKLERLKKKMQTLLEAEGVQIDKHLSSDLNDILRSADLTPAQALFMQQQIKASQVKNMCGMRWHPTLIRVALSVYLKSPTSYDTLRDSGVLQLPSKRTLFDYTHFKPLKEGIDEVALKSVAESVEKCEKSYQVYHVIMADEMYISKNLVFQKSSGRIVGYTKLNDIDEEVKALEAYLDSPDTNVIEPVEATKVLAYMVKGVSNSVKEVIASYPVHTVSPQQMYSWTWHVIGALERCGVAVVAFICDGSSTNRAFIKLHEPATRTSSGVIFDTPNKAAPFRKLYFISDVPHLLKTIRNCFAKSRLGKKGKRVLRKNGQKIVWDTIIKLYNMKKGKTLRKSYKLNPQNVFLDSYSCMKVLYAAQVLSRTVAKDIENQNWQGVSETVKFIILINDWFDCLNGAHSSQGMRKRNPRLEPYTSTEDKRFDFLLSVLDYLKEWKQEAYNSNNVTVNINETAIVENAENHEADVTFTPVEDCDEEEITPAAQRLLSHQTLLGIELTVRSFIDVTKFLLQNETAFVNARVFCQDPLEQYFSKQRGGGSGSTNPNYEQFLSKQRGIHIQGTTGVKRKRRGNTETKSCNLQITEEPLPKRKSVFSLETCLSKS